MAERSPAICIAMERRNRRIEAPRSARNVPGVKVCGSGLERS